MYSLELCVEHRSTNRTRNVKNYDRGTHGAFKLQKDKKAAYIYLSDLNKPYL